MKYLILFQLFFLILSNTKNTLHKKSGENIPIPDTTNAEQYEEIEILDKFFFFWAKTHGNEPVVAIWLSNNTPYTISSILFHAELKSIDNEIPWVEDKFGYTPEKWILPGETLYAEINFAYNWNWENPDIDEALVELNIEILSVYDTLGKMILQNFSPEEDSAGQE